MGLGGKGEVEERRRMENEVRLGWTRGMCQVGIEKKKLQSVLEFLEFLESHLYGVGIRCPGVFWDFVLLFPHLHSCQEIVYR